MEDHDPYANNLMQFNPFSGTLFKHGCCYATAGSEAHSVGMKFNYHLLNMINLSLLDKTMGEIMCAFKQLNSFGYD